MCSEIVQVSFTRRVFDKWPHNIEIDFVSIHDLCLSLTAL